MVKNNALCNYSHRKTYLKRIHYVKINESDFLIRIKFGMSVLDRCLPMLTLKPLTRWSGF